MKTEVSRTIGVIDTTLRDAHQCLWATRMTTAHMLPVADRMDNIGFERIDIAGTIQFDVCVRFLKENPWERIRRMREKLQKTPMSSFTRSKSLVSFDFVPDDIVELWVERLVANGCREIGTFDGLNDVDNMLVTIDAARRLGVRTIGAVAYGLSPVHTDDVYVKTATDLVTRGKVDAIWIKDAGGLLTVDRIRTLVPALRKAIKAVPIELHSHCMTGVAPLVYLEGILAGADSVHTSIAPMANGAAQPATQSTVQNLRAMGHRVLDAQDGPLDDDAEVDRAEAHHVTGVSERVEADEADEHRERNRPRDHQSRADAPEREEEAADHDERPAHQGSSSSTSAGALTGVP